MTNPLTHCNWESGGVLGTGEMPVPNVSAANSTTQIPAGGLGGNHVRGVIVYLHGLTETVGPVPYPVPSSTTAGFANDIQAFATSVVSDGWIFFGPSYSDDFYKLQGCMGVQNDLSNDTNNGLRYLTNMLKWWDHVVNYCYMTFGYGIPIIPFGFSWGAWHVLQIISNDVLTKKCMGYIAHCPATILANAAPNYTSPAAYGAFNTGGLDLTATQLANVTVPGTIGYGTNDAAVGYGCVTAIGSASAGVNVTGILPLFTVGSNTGFVIGAGFTMTGLTGGSSGGRATFSTLTTSGSTGIEPKALLFGSGTTVTGNPVIQSFTSAIIASAGGTCTANSTADHHEFTATDASTYASYVASTYDSSAPKVF